MKNYYMEPKETYKTTDELSEKAVGWLKAHGYYGKAKKFIETDETLEFRVPIGGGKVELHNVRYDLGWSCMDIFERSLG